MIKNIRAKNFKSWEDTGDIRVAPITGFFGTNSSGKTSLLQMLLLLKQTAQSSDPQQVLLLGGENSLVDLGTFYSLIFDHTETSPVEMSLTWRTENEEGSALPTNIDFTTSISERSDRLVVDSFRYTFDDKYIGLRTVDKNEKYELEDHDMGFEEYYPGTSFLEDLYTPVLPKGTLLKPVKYYDFPGGNVWFRISGRGEPLRFYRIGLDLETQLARIAYLGPLRDFPQRTYLWSGDTPSDVGQRGERTIAVLLSERSKGKDSELELKVANWLKKMGLVSEFSVRRTSPSRRDYEIVVKKTPSSAEVLITDIGFGVSQLLPVLVLCYYVPQGSTIIFEQPEIHLHPSVQADLADVFIEVARERNVQIIFESHSEYLLHRLQRRIAEEQLKKEDAALYFCSMGEEASQIEELKLDEYGNIANWPKDFFGDSTGDLIAMTEAAMKRKLAEQT